MAIGNLYHFYIAIEEEVDRRRGRKAILKIGQGWTLPAQLRALKTGQDEKGLFRSYLRCPNDHKDYGIDLTRIKIK